MDRKMFKAEKNSTMPNGNSINIGEYSLVLKFPSSVMFAIVVG